MVWELARMDKRRSA